MFTGDTGLAVFGVISAGDGCVKSQGQWQEQELRLGVEADSQTRLRARVVQSHLTLWSK